MVPAFRPSRLDPIEALHTNSRMHKNCCEESLSAGRELLELPKLVVIPFSRTPSPHQIAIRVVVQSGVILTAHGTAARTAHPESFYPNRRRQPSKSFRPALHFSSHQIIAGCLHVVGS